MAASLTSMARDLRNNPGNDAKTSEGVRYAAEVPNGNRGKSPNGTPDSVVVVSSIYALIVALAMIVINPERTRDENVPCPVQNMQHVGVASLASFVLTYIGLSTMDDEEN